MYNVLLKPSAVKFIQSLLSSEAERVLRALRNLEKDPRPPGCLKLTTEEGYRIRIGRYRVLYEIGDQDKTVVVYRIKHRKDVYRQ
ncbi:type II toxin-antitoxin system RelE/ParE family toxin [candidate division WOR-3 bacterium]|nr:type II toxin-antitoxin system RelE/ParE family toxin [candidate division WOR-3 bacterium]